MTWLACLIVVLGIGMAFGCCCDGVCLDCTTDEIEGLTIAVTIAGVVPYGTDEFCSGSATTCAGGWNGTHMLTYDNGAGTTTCQWENVSASYPGDCADPGRQIYFAAVAASEIVEVTTYSTGATAIGGAYFTYDMSGGQLTCNFDVSLTLDSTNVSDGYCDHSAATYDAATV